MSINITAAIRQDKKDAAGLVPIYIYIYSGAKRVSRFSIGQKVDPDLWDIEKKRVMRQYKNSSLINTLIEKKISDINVKVLEGNITDGTLDVAGIMQQDKIKAMNFFDFAEKQIKEKNYAVETRRNYRVYVEKFRAFKPNLKISQINNPLLQEYEAYLRDTLKNEPNTIWGNFKFINTMTNDAIKAGYIAKDADPFKTFKRVSYKQTKRTFLIASELARIESFVNETEIEGLRLVGKYFLFMCYTGLRYSDAIRFSSSLHIVEGERIVIVTQKTKKETNLYINDKIKPLADFVNENRIYITQIDFNRKLKVIAAGAGINKNVSSHVARHSFGSSLVDLGITIEVAKGLLSHGSTSSTKIYYHLKSANLDEAMKKFNKDIK